MFEAQILVAGDSQGASVTIYSPWSQRISDYLLATVEVVNLTGSVSLKTEIFTKNSEDTSDGVNVNAGTNITQSTVGRADEEWGPSTGTGLKELVRYRFTATVTGVTSDLQWVLFRVLPPLWFDAVKG